MTDGLLNKQQDTVLPVEFNDIVGPSFEIMDLLNEADNDEDVLMSLPNIENSYESKIYTETSIGNLKRKINSEFNEEFNLSRSPMENNKTEYTFPRNLRQKLSSSPSPTSGHITSIMKTSPPLGFSTTSTSEMSTPPDLRSPHTSNSIEGLFSYKKDTISETGSLERNVSYLHIEATKKESPIINQPNLSSPLFKQNDLQLQSPQKVLNKQIDFSAPSNEKQFQEPLKPVRVLERLNINKHEYTILKEIGKGCSGKVFQVLSHTYGEIFALKRIEVKRPEDRQAVMNEIELLKSLKDQDSIVRLLDNYVTPSIIYMVMEFGEIDLATLIHNQLNKNWDLSFIRYYWKQMLQAVSIIHQRKIVHSDLKPANFIVVQGSLKLIDFGIAMKCTDDTTNIYRGVQIGTVNYMSPEALLDTNEGTGRAESLMKLGRPSDIWSLGCILYQMVYGKTPFYHLSLTQKVINIPNPDHHIAFPTIAPHYRNKVPQMLIEILQSCLNRKPSLRPSLAELLKHPFVNSF